MPGYWGLVTILLPAASWMTVVPSADFETELPAPSLTRAEPLRGVAERAEADPLDAPFS